MKYLQEGRKKAKHQKMIISILLVLRKAWLGSELRILRSRTSIYVCLESILFTEIQDGCYAYTKYLQFYLIKDFKNKKEAKIGRIV